MRLPRMRGDRPLPPSLCRQAHKFTPHARGSTLAGKEHALFVVVYPACAGIDPLSLVQAWQIRRLPRMRGDRPVVCVAKSLPDMFTPHARGST